LRRVRTALRHRRRRALRDGAPLPGRYDRALLIGCGVLLTIGIFTAAALGIGHWFERCVDHWRSHFLVQHDFVHVSVERSQARLKQMVEAYEALGELHDHDTVPVERYRERLARQGGVVDTGGDITPSPVTVLSSLTNTEDSERLATLLRLMRAIWPASLGRAHDGSESSGFVYTEDRRFFAAWPPVPADKLHASLATGVEPLIARYVANVDAELNKQAEALLLKRRVFWVAFYDSDLYGARVKHYAAPIYRGDKRIAVLVVTVPLAAFPRLLPTDLRDPDFFLMSRDRRQLLGLEESNPRIKQWRRVLASSPDLLDEAGDIARLVRRGGNFFVLQRIDGPNWIALYAFDWRMIAANLREQLIWTSLIVGFLLSLLWAFIAFVWAGIARRKAVIRRLRDARYAAVEASEAKSMLVATISHEIRTPLHGALGNLELLAAETLTPSQAARVGAIRRAFDALLALMDDVLDLQKADVHELRLNAEPFRLDDVIERCAQTFAPAITRKGLRFICLIDPHLAGTWRGDKHRISQILTNLVGNACKFTERGEIVIRASVVGAGESIESIESVELAVEDTGIGIAPCRQARIFEPFVQADGTIAQRFGGSGLGLSLCRRLVELMRGHIALQSIEDKGSVFTVTLPLQREQSLGDASLPHDDIAFDTIVVACAHRAWQETLLAQMRHWYPAVSVIGSEGGARAAPRGARAIVVLGSHVDAMSQAWEAVRSTYVDAVVLSERGPLHPQRRGNALYITALAAAKLRAALGACGTCDSRLDGVAASAPSQHLHVRDEKGSAEVVRVLIVDDSPVNLCLLVDQLQTLGYTQIDRATDGAEALTCCLRQRYDVIIADLCMPKMDGHAMLGALRKAGITTPVIANTAASCDAAKAKADGFFDVLRKPVSISRLRTALEEVLDLSKPLKSSRASPATTTTHSPSLAKALQAAFTASWPDDEAALRKAVAQADEVAMLRTLHRVGGALAVLGEREANCRCAVLHELIKALGMQAVAAQVEPFVQTLSQIAARPCVSDDAA
jgi:signal transduction histidine kinase/CheY-like chemotaxis protein